MSIQAVGWALDQDVPDPAAKLVLISLCNAHNGGTQACHPSHSRIAQEASCSARTVIRKLKWLEENGWIETIPRYDGSGRSKSNTYRIALETGGDNLSLGGDTVVRGEGDTVVTPLKGTVRNTVKEKNTKKENDEFFESYIWPQYPKKIEKAQSKSAFLVALKKIDKETLCAKLAQYVSVTDPRYLITLHRWFSRERWLDEPAQPPPKQSTRRTAIDAGKDWINEHEDEAINSSNAQRLPDFSGAGH